MNDIDVRFHHYPPKAKEYAGKIRSLIHETATQEGIPKVEESLKWGEPSFKSPHGSPFRMDWKDHNPEHFYLFFHCQSLLVETFKVIYGSDLKYEGNRAIVLDMSQDIPTSVLQHCFSLALKYHKLKNLPLLGA